MPTWDEVIDETARRLTDSQPRVGFTTRVVARLDERPRRWSRAWLLAPPAAAAIIVLAVVMPREEVGEVEVRPVRSSAGTDVPLKPEAMPVADPGIANNDPRLKPDATPRQLAATAPAADVAIPADLGTDLVIAPIEPAPVAVAATIVDALEEPPPLAVEAITIDAIDVAQ
jgi:hypothetical protein